MSQRETSSDQKCAEESIRNLNNICMLSIGGVSVKCLGAESDQRCESCSAFYSENINEQAGKLLITKLIELINVIVL